MFLLGFERFHGEMVAFNDFTGAGPVAGDSAQERGRHADAHGVAQARVSFRGVCGGEERHGESPPGAPGGG